MNRQEMHIAFRVGYGNINANKPKMFLPQEIDVILNQSYNTFVESFVKPKQSNPDNFTHIQRSLDAIQPLIKEASTINVIGVVNPLKLSTLDDARVSLVLPIDYLHLVDDSSDTEVKCRLFNRVPNRLFASDIVNTILNTYLYGTTVTSPVSEVLGNTLYVYKSGFSIANVYIKYIRKYNPIGEGQNCELPEFTHDTIVNNAISKAMAIINGGSYEKFVNEITKN